VSQIAFTSDASTDMQQTIRKLLRADEQLLWWDCPQLKRMRFPLTASDIISALIFGTVSAMLFTALFYVAKSMYTQRPPTSGVYIEIFSGIFVCGLLFAYLRPLQRTFSDILKAVPPYRQYTLYAITDRRAMIIVSLPGMEPTVLEYLPHEIETPTGLMRSHLWPGASLQSQRLRTICGTARQLFWYLSCSGCLVPIAEAQSQQ
jgi:hypothetical protein